MGMEQIIRVKNLKIAFPPQEIVHGVSFDLHRGELLALVGESGSGKTLLCRSLLGLPPQGAVVSFDTLERPQATAMSLVMQNALTALDPAMPVGKQIKEANPNCRFTPVELLTQVGIDNPQARSRQYPGEFSGGMRQRAAIAVALAMDPAVIFADEPTTSLDAPIRRQIMELLAAIRKDYTTSILFVTHDLSIVRDFADRVLIMKKGEIIESGLVRDLFANPQEEYTKELIRSAAMHSPENHTHGKTHFHGSDLHSHVHAGQHIHNDLRPTSNNDLPPSDNDLPPALPLLEVKKLSKYYYLNRKKVNRVLENINMKVYPGEIVGLCGPSGIGKSTLARCLAGLEKPSGGERLVPKALDIQMIFQDSASALNPRLTIEQIIGEPLYIRTGKRPAREFILDLMRQTELEPELIAQYPHTISGGQRQRVAIARAIAVQPDLIIADEPVSSLDVTTCSKIIHLLKRLKDEHHLTMLLISHDLHLLAHVSDRIIKM